MPADGPRLHRFANHSMTSRNFGTSKAVSWLDRRLYPAFSDHWDDALFRAKVLDHLDPSATLLDLGAGSGIVPHMDFKDRAGLVCGLDLDPRVSANPLLVDGIDHVEGRPEYLRFSAPSYLAGFVYERVVNRTRLLSRFRVILIAVMRKPRYLS